MKKLALTIAIVLGMTIGAFAQGGLFQYGAVSDEDYYGSAMYYDRTTGTLFPILPGHGATDNEPAPLGSGVVLLMGLGAAYAAAKKRKE
jgi:hypothetical protein